MPGFIEGRNVRVPDDQPAQAGGQLAESLFEFVETLEGTQYQQDPWKWTLFKRYQILGRPDWVEDTLEKNQSPWGIQLSRSGGHQRLGVAQSPRCGVGVPIRDFAVQPFINEKRKLEGKLVFVRQKVPHRGETESV